MRRVLNPHTPGPWKAFGPVPGAPTRFPIVGARMDVAGLPHRKRFVAVLGERHDDPRTIEELQANARLIAAAPELYQCLQMLMLVWAQGEFASETERREIGELATTTFQKICGVIEEPHR